jgi:uncharacterized protein YdeI (YjbR/CyaY-like superfamily)
MKLDTFRLLAPLPVLETGMLMEMFNGIEVMPFDDAPTWEAWLATHHQKQEGIWLKIAKKSSGIPSLTDDEAVDLGLCYGWISGQRKFYDGVYYLQKYVPRRPRSRWSQVNVAKVEELIAAGRMRQSGLKEIEAAQADGRWNLASEMCCNARRGEKIPLAIGIGSGDRGSKSAEAGSCQEGA